jgi:hypothetical protein
VEAPTVPDVPPPLEVDPVMLPVVLEAVLAAGPEDAEVVAEARLVAEVVPEVPATGADVPELVEAAALVVAEELVAGPLVDRPLLVPLVEIVPLVAIVPLVETAPVVPAAPWVNPPLLDPLTPRSWVLHAANSGHAKQRIHRVIGAPGGFASGVAPSRENPSPARRQSLFERRDEQAARVAGAELTEALARLRLGAGAEQRLDL